jgi:hypothetical protein
MQPSILFRLVLVLLAMSVATVLACVPERAGGEESSSATSVATHVVRKVSLLAASADSSASAELRNAGVPTCGFTGLRTDLADTHEHGRDERVSVQAFHEGHESLLQVAKLLSAAASAPAQR